MKTLAQLFIAVFFVNLSFSQTKGMIVVPASSPSGAAVLDPNGNGYVSQSASGFIANDISESEIPYITLIPAGNEPSSDITNAPNCGFTDFVESTAGGLDPVMHYYNTTSGNWLFRLRMGNISSNSKSYSILIDSDNLFGSADAATYNSSNPGFEFEIVLATNVGISIYNHSNGLNCTPTVSSVGNANYQKAIANSTVCNQTNYFMDFFITAADLAAMGINPSTTAMRFACVDNTSANASSLCSPSSASDIAAVNNAQCTSLASCLTTVVQQQSGCTLNQINAGGSACQAVTLCPSMSGPITAGSTTISGSSSEAAGTTIKVYSTYNSTTTQIGTTTVAANGSWTCTVSPATIAGATISATAQATGKLVSSGSCNAYAIPSCSTPLAAAPVITNATGKNICGTGLTGYSIQVYYQNNSLFPANPSTSAYLPVTAAGDWTWKCTGNTGGCNAGSGVDCIAEGGYMVLQVGSNGCPSLPAFACVSIGGGYATGTSATPTLTASSVATGNTSVSGTIAFNAAPAPQSGYIYLFLNDAYYGISSLITTAGNFTVSCPALPACGTLTARFMQASSTIPSDHDCFSAVSNAVTIGGVTSTPAINGPICSPIAVTSISGTSSEPNGTTIQVYENGVLEGTTTVSNGGWTLSSISLALGSTVTAKATYTAGCKSQSLASTGVVVTQQTTGTAAISPVSITENATSVSGTGVVGATVNLLIDEYPVYQNANHTTLATAVVNASGLWTISSIYSGELYSGGTVKVQMTIGSNCTGVGQDPTPVVCAIPTKTMTVSPDSTNICSGSSTVAISISNTQSGVIYQAFNLTSGSDLGSSVIGTGSTVTLTTSSLSANTTIAIKALKFPYGTCYDTLNERVYFTVSALTLPTASVTAQPNCTVTTGTITFSSPTGANIQYSSGGAYQSSPIFSGLAPGTYSVTSKNTTTGCISTPISLTVNAVPTAPVAPSATVTTQPSCALTTGTITVTAPTGASIVYSVGGTYQSSGTFSGLTPGSYSVTAKDNSTGCISTATSLTVNAVPTAPATPTASVTTQPNCTVTTGTIAITAPTGASIVYSVGGTYQSSGTFSGLTPGSYSVTAKDNSTGCISTATSLTVNAVPTAPAAPTASVTTQPTCSVSTGIITVTAPTGASIVYSVGGTYQSSGTFSGLAAGTYSVTAKDNSTTCVSSATSLTINPVASAPATPTASVTTQPNCTVTTGTIAITAPTGASIVYSVGGTYQSSGTFSALASGTYSVTAKDNTTGCISSPLSLTVNAVPTAPATPTASVTAQPTCLVSTGTIAVTAPTGASILYSNGGTYQSSGTFSALAPGTYSITAKDNSTTCVSNATTLTINAIPTALAAPTASVTVQPNCSVQTGTIVITAPTGSAVVYSIGGSYQSSATFSGLAPGTYTITAKDTVTSCNSVSSTTLTVNPVSSGASCACPPFVATNTVYPYSANLSWQVVPGAAWYEFRYREIGSATWQTAGTLIGSSTNKLLQNLNSGTNYEFQAKSFCTWYQSSNWSSSVNFTTLTPTGCYIAPTLTNQATTPYTLTVGWASVPGTGWYELRYKESTSATWISAGTMTSSATSKLIQNLNSNTSYDVQIRSFCSVYQFSQWGTSITITTATPADCNTAPVINQSTPSAQSVSISWTPITGAAWYEVRYKESASSTWLSAGTQVAPTATKTISGLLPNVAYDFQVRSACEPNNYSPWSHTLSVSTSGSSAISLASNEPTEMESAVKANSSSAATLSEVSIYPNPSNGKITVVHTEDLTFEFYSEYGQLITKGELSNQNNKTVTISGLAPGIYFLVATQNADCTVHKVIVQ